jgi:hypothetical protein
VRVRSPSFVRRGAHRSFTIAFPAAPTLSGRDDGSSRSLSPAASTHPEVRRTCRPLPVNAGLAVLRTARPLRSIAPPGGPFRSTLASAGEGLAAGALLGLSPSRALSSNDPGSGLSRSRACGARYPCHARLRAPDVCSCRPRTEHRPGVHEPRVRRRTPSQNRCALPSSCRSCPLSAAPRASLPFTPRSPAKGLATLDLEDAGLGSSPTTPFFRSRRDPPLDRSGSLVGPPVARKAGSRGISSLVDRAPPRTEARGSTRPFR